MISKSKLKYLHSLELKKNRDALGVFVAEGPKVVGDILSCHRSKVCLIVATDKWIDSNRELLDTAHCEVVSVSDAELSKASFLCHPQQVVAVFQKFGDNTPKEPLEEKLILALDGVQDPGNLGTIIRIADWFGIEHIVCSEDTVDVYNPKVVQATMGSIARVSVSYTSLDAFLSSLPHGMPIYGTLLEGDNMYHSQLANKGVVVMGNEGNGISPAIRQRITNAIRIPNYPEGRDTAESLNVAVATAIVCAEFRRLK